MTEVIWKCPSNIALVKYWGKKGNQLPANSSISFTLNECFTKTSIKLKQKNKSNKIEFSFLFEGKSKAEFEPKLQNFFGKTAHLFPFINEYFLEINSENSFPHSSGIASSASAFGALALCICSIENGFGTVLSKDEFYKKASFIARLGSGSACRSVFATMALWGKTRLFDKSNDEFAVKYDLINPVFKNYCDTILVVQKGEKEVSSTLGHSLLINNPFAEARFIEAEKNLELLLIALKNGDLELFNKITEAEALMLHALMMTSDPYFILMKPNTLNIINSVWNYRKSAKLNMTITLDAGANVHLLYPENQKKQVHDFITNELTQYCSNNYFINDNVGMGPSKLK